MGDYLSAEAILAFDDVQVRDVPVPEWNGTVRLRSMSGRERDSFEASLREVHGKDIVINTVNSRAGLVARCAINPDTGERLFTDQQINALGEKNAAVLDRLYEVAAELSGLGGEEELAGKSEAAPSGDSGSSSPES